MHAEDEGRAGGVDVDGEDCECERYGGHREEEEEEKGLWVRAESRSSLMLLTVSGSRYAPS